MTKKATCWCRKKLISAIECEDGTWFPLGFLNCPVHACWYESKEEYNEHLAKVLARRGTPRHTG